MGYCNSITAKHGKLESAQAAIQPLPVVAASGVAAALPVGMEPWPPVAAASAVPVPKVVAQAGKNAQSHPFEGLSIHIIGFIENSKKWLYTFSADQNGQPVFMMTQAHLEQSGYKVEKLSECSARIRYNKMAFFATCDIRSVGMAPHGMVGSL